MHRLSNRLFPAAAAGLMIMVATQLVGQEVLQRTPPKADERVTYGSDANQFADVRRPPKVSARPHLVVMIHGGYWRARYSLDHLGHAAAALTAKGVVTYSLEYRRIGQPGGGWPGTWQDIQAGIAKAIRDVKPGRVTVIGHSAGGHLTLLAGNEPGVDHVVAVAPVADLRRAWEMKASNGVVGELLGMPPEPKFAEASPMERGPVKAKVTIIHGSKDEVVPFDMGAAYARKFKARLIELTGAGHFEVIDPLAKEWSQIEEAVLGSRP
ncbi:MAG: alpha/beta hydrolase [Acidobacteria bacterium]|nr:alpha/beta hydrolase [Acidobacteriota bacterium]